DVYDFSGLAEGQTGVGGGGGADFDGGFADDGAEAFHLDADFVRAGREDRGNVDAVCARGNAALGAGGLVLYDNQCVRDDRGGFVSPRATDRSGRRRSEAQRRRKEDGDDEQPTQLHPVLHRTPSKVVFGRLAVPGRREGRLLRWLAAWPVLGL